MGLISVLIGVLVIVVVGAICFWAIDKFANDRRLANLLKLLVVLICLGAILQRVLPLIALAILSSLRSRWIWSTRPRRPCDCM
jgi:hypothetical protein